MQWRTHHAVYNSRIAGMPRPISSRIATSSLLLVIFLLAPRAAGAQNRSGAEAELAGRIAAIVGRSNVLLEVVNRSSLDTGQVDDIRRNLLTELLTLGLRFADTEPAAAAVRVSLSENLSDYIWVAEIRQSGREPAVVMVSRPRGDGAKQPVPAAMAVRKTPLWSQANRILDVATPTSNPPRLLVLSAGGASLYRAQEGRWQLEQPLPVAHARPWPRDLRGRLLPASDHVFDLYLPGVSCRSSAGFPLTLSCFENNNPWPLGTEAGVGAVFASSRNFFTGLLSPGIGKQTTIPAFYSAAVLPGQPGRWVLATVDGQVYWLDGQRDQAWEKLNWGSDIASVRSGCGSGGQVLATPAGETPTENMRAFEVTTGDPVAVSGPLELEGKLTALWTDWSGNGAVAVLRKTETESYEAVRLTVTCGR